MPDMSASASLATTHLVTLAEFDQNKVTPGVLGFIVFAAMALAVWGLMKSMSRHMGKVDFKEPSETEKNKPRKGTPGSGTAQPSKG
ncbi:hypothetical protein [Streptomyces carpinensis]|uniref:Uncharacterized protein n=1 Tax=Streptomyces carpinensis TaxID=66369 RepID=A0ABV1W4E1_9ACTN|nr:hypothetical protein [Streptomyces carpinensis]